MSKKVAQEVEAVYAKHVMKAFQGVTHKGLKTVDVEGALNRASKYAFKELMETYASRSKSLLQGHAKPGHLKEVKAAVKSFDSNDNAKALRQKVMDKLGELSAGGRLNTMLSASKEAEEKLSSKDVNAVRMYLLKAADDGLIKIDKKSPDIVKPGISGTEGRVEPRR